MFKIVQVVLTAIWFSVLFAAIACNNDKITGSGGVTEDFWKHSGLDSTHVTSLTVSPNGNVFAGARRTRKGIYRSTDNGESWAKLSNGLTNRHMLAIAADFNGDIFAATIPHLFTVEFIQSTNHGITWREINEPSGINNNSFVFNSQDHIFVGSVRNDEHTGGVYRSTDRGASWTQAGLSNTISIAALDIASNGTIFAGAYNGLYLTRDNGTSWTKTMTGLRDSIVLSFAIYPDGLMFTSTLRDGIYRSTDNGNAWTLTALRKFGVEFLIGTSSGDIFAGIGNWGGITPEGVFYSNNNGTTWLELNGGLTDRNVTNLLPLTHRDTFL